MIQSALGVIVLASLLASPAGLPISLSVQVSEASRMLEEAKALYEQGLFGQAIEKLQQTIDALRRDVDLESRRFDLADAHLHRGLSHFALGELEAAKESFKQVVRLDPSWQLDPETFAPSVVALFGEAREEASREPSAPPEPAPPLDAEGRSALPFVLIGAGGAAGVAVALGSGGEDAVSAPVSSDVDADADGFTSRQDCDDMNPEIRPMGPITFESTRLNDAPCDICAAGGPACPRKSPPVFYTHLAQFKATNNSCEPVTVSSIEITMIITGVEGVPGNLHDYLGREFTAPPFIEEAPPGSIPGNGAETLFDLPVRNQCFDIPSGQGGRLLSIYRYTVNTSRGTFIFEGRGPKAEYPVDSSGLRTMVPANRTVSVVTQLAVTGAAGLVRIADSTFEIRGESTRLLDVPVTSGSVEIEAFLTSPGKVPGFWKFDFPSSSDFQPGSIEWVEGDVEALGADTILFRSSGRPGERHRYRIQVKRH